MCRMVGSRHFWFTGEKAEWEGASSMASHPCEAQHKGPGHCCEYTHWLCNAVRLLAIAIKIGGHRPGHRTSGRSCATLAPTFGTRACAFICATWRLGRVRYRYPSEQESQLTPNAFLIRCLSLISSHASGPDSVPKASDRCSFDQTSSARDQ